MSKWLNRANTAAILFAGAAVLYQLAVVSPASQWARWDRPAGGKQTLAVLVARMQPGLDQCGEAAVLLHDISWASACMFEAEDAGVRHADCLRDPLVMNNPQLGKMHCDKKYDFPDDSAECTLPAARAATLNASLKDAEDRCLEQARAAKVPG